MIDNKRPFIYFPILFSIVFIGGLYLGSRLSTNVNEKNLFPIKFNSFNRLNEIINYVEQEYVDTVDRHELESKVIAQLLQDLDPHSYYISPEEISAMNEPLIGNFDGIGVEFSIQKDTIVVLAPVVGGPSEMLGIKAGDRIVKVEGENVASIGITNRKVMDLLRGPKGSKVAVSIFRQGESKLIDFTIERDKIPIHSLDASYMLTPTIGYIKLSRFSKTTYSEFSEAAEKLKKEGMTHLALDLRGNGGGYLDAAIDLADEFLSKGKLIVYTEGKARPKKMHYATGKGNFETIELSILIDEGSASASEIIAGAIQDNDRGTVIGRRSFGKGLVQEQSDWPDGSAVRLTIARYYTPTGRCIQRPYKEGVKKYYEDFYEDMEWTMTSEAQPDTTIIADSLIFKTPEGKIVYGGGGITPDIFVPVDTLGGSAYLSELSYNGIFRNFSFDYADKNRKKLERFQSVNEFIADFTITNSMLNDLYAIAEKSGIKKREKEIEKSQNRITVFLKANIARFIWHNEGYYMVLSDTDPVLQKVKIVKKEL